MLTLINKNDIINLSNEREVANRLMNKNEELVLKMNLLGGMDAYIRHVVGDEDLIDEWNMYGVPDEASEDDLKACASINFAEICAKFGQLVNMAEVG